MQLDMGFWVDITSYDFDDCYDKYSLPIYTVMTVEKVVTQLDTTNCAIIIIFIYVAFIFCCTRLP